MEIDRKSVGSRWVGKSGGKMPPGKRLASMGKQLVQFEKLVIGKVYRTCIPDVGTHSKYFSRYGDIKSRTYGADLHN